MQPPNLRHPLSSQHQRRCAGAVLLEVILALILFVGAATVIGSSLSASVRSIDRLRDNAHGANLTRTLISRLELGMLPLAPTAPQPMPPPFGHWMFEITLPGGQPETEGPAPWTEVEVAVRNTDTDAVYRLHQRVPAPAPEGSPEMFELLDDAAAEGPFE